MEISKEVKDSVKTSVGYNECDNKGSFIIGSDVAFVYSERFYTSVIKTLQEQVEMYKSAYENTLSDMQTVVDVFSKYQEKN